MEISTTSMKVEEISPWRLRIGTVMFTLSIVLPLVGVPVVASMDLSVTLAASVSGGLLAGGELMGIAAIVVMGKSGYTFIKSKVFGLFKQYGPPEKVSPLRYKIGLTMFLIPILFGWVSPYLFQFVLDKMQAPLIYVISGDILLLSSLFVLGGEFWEKLRSLFIQDIQVFHSDDTENNQNA